MRHYLLTVSLLSRHSAFAHLPDPDLTPCNGKPLRQSLTTMPFEHSGIGWFEADSCKQTSEGQTSITGAASTSHDVVHDTPRASFFCQSMQDKPENLSLAKAPAGSGPEEPEGQVAQAHPEALLVTFGALAKSDPPSKRSALENARAACEEKNRLLESGRPSPGESSGEIHSGVDQKLICPVRVMVRGAP